jgi:hypothetical protein
MKKKALVNSTHSIFNMSKKILLFTTLVFLLSSCSVEIRIDGCTDSIAYNYDPQADDNDGSCIYYGCTDPSAINYDSQAGIEPTDACEYTCDVVYYLDQSAWQFMILNGINYYQFYDYNGSNLGFITSDYYWNSPPNCIPQNDGSTLTATLSWFGNYDSYSALFSWSAYGDDVILDYEGTFVVYPNECARVELSWKKIQEYKASK